MGSNITCTVYCNDRVAATLYTLEIWFILVTFVDIRYKGIQHYNNNNNNNNNSDLVGVTITIPVSVSINPPAIRMRSPVVFRSPSRQLLALHFSHTKSASLKTDSIVK
jgi:hypothetical protein